MILPDLLFRGSPITIFAVAIWLDTGSCTNSLVTPFFTPVTIPSLDTVAIFVFNTVYVKSSTLLPIFFITLNAFIVAFTCFVSPISKLILVTSKFNIAFTNNGSVFCVIPIAPKLHSAV